MTFTSFKFLLILPLLVGLYHVLPERCRVLFLLLASYGYICAVSVRAAIALAAATLFTFLAGKYVSEQQQRAYLVFLSTISLLTVWLCFFKAATVLPLGSVGRLAAPLGLSYYTFKLMSYIIDIHWGKIEPARSLTEFATAIAFFPQITAGPIQRPAEFLSQLAPDRTAFWMGLSRVVWGLAKKVIVADNLAPTVNYVFAHTHALHGASLLTGFYLFPLQMYADFSALTDIALGMGLMFGIVGPENFNRPFTATSISDFWRRWHMSLTNWLADYVFTPLRMATRSAGTAGLALSITINMLAVGLWHGFTWGYFVFGALNAAYLVADALTTRQRASFFKARQNLNWLGNWAGQLLTLHLFFIAMVFFRARTVGDAAWVLSHMLRGLGTFASDATQATAGSVLLLGLTGYALLELAERYRPDQWWAQIEPSVPAWTRWTVRCTLGACIVAAFFLLTVRPGSQETSFLYQVF